MSADVHAIDGGKIAGSDVAIDAPDDVTTVRTNADGARTAER